MKQSYRKCKAIRLTEEFEVGGQQFFVTNRSQTCLVSACNFVEQEFKVYYLYL